MEIGHVKQPVRYMSCFLCLCAGKFWEYYRSAIIGQHIQFSSKCYTFTHCRLHWLSVLHTLINVSTLISHKCFSQVPAALGTQQPQPQSNLLVQDTEGMQCKYILHPTQLSSLHLSLHWCLRLLFWKVKSLLHFIPQYWSQGTLEKNGGPSKTLLQIDSSDIILCNEWTLKNNKKLDSGNTSNLWSVCNADKRSVSMKRRTHIYCSIQPWCLLNKVPIW